MFCLEPQNCSYSKIIRGANFLWLGSHECKSLESLDSLRSVVLSNCDVFYISLQYNNYLHIYHSLPTCRYSYMLCRQSSSSLIIFCKNSYQKIVTYNRTLGLSFYFSLGSKSTAVLFRRSKRFETNLLY